VDLTHGVPAGDIQAGAFALASAYRYFPKNTIHVAVVDPGVGSDRAALAVKTNDFIFIGPDNGLLSIALDQQNVVEIRSLGNRDWMLPKVSQTFHGRDVFAPIAAHLAAGGRFSSVGTRVESIQQLRIPKPSRGEQRVDGAVVYVDRYGNAITNISNDGFLNASVPADVFVKKKRITRIHDCYQAVAPGKPVCVPGSSGFLEIAVNQGNAASQLRLRVGSSVAVRW